MSDPVLLLLELSVLRVGVRKPFGGEDLVRSAMMM